MIPIEQCQIALRPRTGWEALDLGIAMGQWWCWELWRIWFAVSFLPVALLSFWLRDWTLPFGLPDKNIPIPGVLFVIWWLKPLFERALLSVLQQALFNKSAATGGVLKKTAYSWLKWGVGDLFWRRLSWGRSFIMPITQLEGNSYRATRQRVKLLRSHYGRLAGIAGLLFGFFEAIFFFGVLVLGYMLLPGAWEQAVFDLLTEHPQWIFWGCIALYYAVLSLLEPFYVASGFALYLHSRTELEAWDIQLKFTQLVRRAKRTSRASTNTTPMGRTIGGLLLGCVALGMAGMSLQDARAETLPSFQPPVGETRGVKDDARCTAWEKKLEMPTSDPLKRTLQAILKAPEFYPCRTEGRWMKRPDRQDVRVPQWLARGFENFTQGIDRIDAERTESRWSLPWLGEWVKWILLAALGIGVLAVIIGLLYRLIRRRKRLPRSVPQVDRAIGDWQASPLPTNPLPADPLAAVRQFCDANEIRAALSLLYRYAINELAEQFAVPVPPDATEAECLTLIAGQVKPEVADWCQELIEVWQRVAYAHRLPTVDSVLSLCHRWVALIGGEHER